MLLVWDDVLRKIGSEGDIPKVHKFSYQFICLVQFEWKLKLRARYIASLNKSQREQVDKKVGGWEDIWIWDEIWVKIPNWE